MGTANSNLRPREMEEASSSRSRNPLSDRTNTIDDAVVNPNPNPSQSSSTSTKNSSSIIKPTRNLISKPSVATKPSKTQANPATGSSGEFDDKVTKPSAVLVPSVSTPSRTPKRPSPPEGTDLHETSEPSSVYVQRRSAAKTQRKEKEIAVPNLITKHSVATKPSKTQADAATGSSTRPSGECDDKVTKSSAVLVPSVSTPSRAPKGSSAEGTDLHETSEPSSVYVRGCSAAKTQIKEKEIAVPKSCIPPIKTRSKRDKMNEDGVSSLSKSCPAPKRKRQRQTTPEVHALPQDFIEQQKAYFAEVDAFELSEEEVDALSE